jgi:hypothetical protein
MYVCTLHSKIISHVPVHLFDIKTEKQNTHLASAQSLLNENIVRKMKEAKEKRDGGL